MINAVNATTPTNNISYVSKPNTIALRPHHFLCLPGYKGYNYNQAQVNSWDIISKQLKDNPDTDILIKSGKDDLNKKIKKEENDIKKREKYTNSITFYLLQKAKISKAVYTAQLDLGTKLIKKYVQVLTNVAYEAVKLQNTKEEDIKEESASIDLLNKYLQRI